MRSEGAGGIDKSSPVVGTGPAGWRDDFEILDFRSFNPSIGLRTGFAQDGVCGYWGFSLTAKLRRSIIYIKLTESE